MADHQAAALAVNHVGITVPDIFGAIDWYGELFDFRCIMGPRVIDSDGHGETSKVFGPAFRRAWQAHLITANSVGLELFQFIEPAVDPRPVADEIVGYRRRGPWHLCLTHPDPGALIDRIADRGGTRLTAAIDFVPGRPWQLAYGTDPWGTVLEVMSHSYPEVFANWPQPGQLHPPILVDRLQRIDADDS